MISRYPLLEAFYGCAGTYSNAAGDRLQLDSYPRSGLCYQFASGATAHAALIGLERSRVALWSLSPGLPNLIAYRVTQYDNRLNWSATFESTTAGAFVRRISFATGGDELTIAFYSDDGLLQESVLNRKR